MSPQKLLRRLLVTAWILVDAALIQHQWEQQASWPHPLAACVLGLVFGQAGLLCAWLVWSRQRRSFRLATVVAGLCVASTVAALSTDGLPHTKKWLTLLATYALLVGAPLAAVRFSDVEGGSAAGASWVASPRRSRQISLGTLFSWTTCAAVLLGVSRWCELPAKHPICLLAFCLVMALASLMVLAIAWRCRNRLLVFLIPALFCPLLGGLLLLTALPPKNTLVLVLMVCVQGAVILASVAVLRVADRPRCDAVRGDHLSCRRALMRT